MKRISKSAVWMALPIMASLPTAAYAQNDTTLISPAVPPGFNKGRNVSVTERSRPDYDPLGIPLGGFNLYPQVQTGVGFTSNALLEVDDPRSDAFVLVAPQVRLVSDWNVHSVTADAGFDVTRYLSVTERNQTEWHLRTRGRYDYSDGLSVTGDASVERDFETPFSGAIAGNLTALSSYIRSYGAVRADYQGGQFRGVLSADLSDYNFAHIDVPGGERIDQSDRDRKIGRITGQAEYAMTPSASTFGRIGFDRIVYDRLLLTGEENRDASGLRASIGWNVDLTGLLRGTVGLGYVRRDYDSSLYRDVSGFSAEAQVEFFYSELTTFTLEASRTIQDANVRGVNAFFDNRVSARADHELLRNLILNAEVEYSRQNYIASDNSNDIVRFSAGGRYLATPRYGLEANVSYTDRSADGNAIGRSFNELRALVSFVYHP